MPRRTLAVLVALTGCCVGQFTPSSPGHNKYEVAGLGYDVGILPNKISLLDNEAKLLKSCELRKRKLVTIPIEKKTNILTTTNIHIKCDFNLKTPNITNEACSIQPSGASRFISHSYTITPLKSKIRRRRELSWTAYIEIKGTVPKSPNQSPNDWVSKYVSHSNAAPKPNTPIETNRFGGGQPNTGSWTSFIGSKGPDRTFVHSDKPNTSSWMSYIGNKGPDKGPVHIDQPNQDSWFSYIGGKVTDRVDIDQDKCGKVTIANPYPLLINSKPTLAGQWPWQIALLHNKYFTCGGTLVSRQHVVTAAHCVTLEKSRDLVNKDELTVSLGIHNLRTSTQGVQNKNVDNIIVHPQYSGSTYANDLSVVRLAESVEITDYVRPACLWPENQVDLSNVIGKTGMVVGWGQNENRVITDELGLVKMPIVGQQDCLNVNRLYDRSRWSTTYCAGFRDDTTACYGDSGGGMVIRLQDTWYLRGLVSLTINDCDPSHYIIFTDLAKFLSWIKENMQ